MLVTLASALKNLVGIHWKDYEGPDKRALEMMFLVPGIKAQLHQLFLTELTGAQQSARLNRDPETGVAKASIAPGRYAVQYRAKANQPNQAFTFRINSPADAAVTLAPPATADKHNNINNVHVFTTDLGGDK